MWAVFSGWWGVEELRAACSREGRFGKFVRVGWYVACLFGGGGGYVGSLVVRKHDLVFMILAADAAV